MPMKSAFNLNHHVSLHTDTPSSPLNIFHAMRTAVTRKTTSGKYLLGEDEMITVDEAIKAVTINAAWQIFEENTRGSLEIGKLADFVILSKNLRTTKPNEWTDIKIHSTYLAGHKVDHSKWNFHKASLLAQLSYALLKQKLLSTQYIFIVISIILLILMLILRKIFIKKSNNKNILNG